VNANVSVTIHIGMTIISSMDAASFMSLNFHPCNVPLCNDQLHHYCDFHTRNSFHVCINVICVI
jgi:hypothetical protein